MTYFPPAPRSSLNEDKVMQYVQRNAHTFYQQLTLAGVSVTDLAASGNVTVDGTLFVTGNTTLSTLGTSGAATLASASVTADLSVGGEVFLADGTAGAPSLSYAATGQQDVGFYRSGTDAIGVALDGSNVATFQSTAGHNLAGLAWTTFTPSPTNVTIGTGGNPLSQGRYVRIGNTVHCEVVIVLGTTGEAVSGAVSITLPVTATALPTGTTGVAISGECHFVEAGVAINAGSVRKTSTTAVTLLAHQVSGTDIRLASLDSTTPFTWADGDYMTAGFSYEAA